jgi:ketosteroid isomerase-like protein
VATIRDDRTALFRNLQSPDTQPQFWARVAEDVDWTVEGTRTLAGRYHDKHDFIKATFDRLDGVLHGGARLDVEHLYLDGDTTIAGLLSISVSSERARLLHRVAVRAGDGGRLHCTWRG